MPAREPQFLAEASLLLSRSLDSHDAIAGLAGIAVPAIADWCLIHLRIDGEIVLVAQEVADASKRELARELIARFPPEKAPENGIARVLHGAPSELYAEIPDEVLVANIHDPDQLAATRELGYRSAMVVPIVGRGDVLGAITFMISDSGRRYGPESLAVAEDLGRRAGLILENLGLYEAEREARRGVERLIQLADRLTTAVEVHDVAEIFVEAGCEAMGADAGFAWLIDDSGTVLQLAASRGYAGELLETFRRFSVDAPIPLCDAIKAREPILFPTLAEMVTRYPATSATADSPFHAFAAVPFVLGERGLGGVSFSFREQRHFDAAERALLTAMTRQASLALERCRLFSAERRATEQAKLAERKKDEFLAMLGHELRNPLAPLVTAVDLIRLRDPDAFPREREVIERAVGHLTRLIDDLLDVSRITRGMVSLTRSPIDVSRVIEHAIEMASPLLERRRHHLQREVAVGELYVDADPIRLAQVFQNLVGNAAKYTPAGGHIWVSAARDGGEVVVRVGDDGTGIDPELLPRIFDLFTQGARPIDRGEGGLGIGLTLVKRLVELHGGTVTAFSDGRDRGTLMTVRLPAVARREAASPPPERTMVAAGTRRVLVVDDNADAAETLAEILRNLGFVVATAPDGPTALDLAKAFDPQICVLDIGLPVMDGYELAQRMRSDRTAVILIAVTGYGQDDDVARSRAAGFDHHLVKPVDLRQLEAALNSR
jgi:signal transduction histidine kinase